MPDQTAGGEDEAAFRVRDRRRVGREDAGDAPPEGEPAGAAESQPAGQATAEEAAAEARLPPVADFVRLFIVELQTRAWMHMGFIVDPATKQLAKDLPQARLAIDCIASLIEHLGPVTDKAERAELERMLADLRINFVRLSGT